MTTDREPEKRKTASERLAEALGRPRSRPMTEAERRAFQEKLDRAEEEAARIYGSGEGAVA